MIHMGHVVRQLREDKNWTVARLERASGVNRNTIYQIEATGGGCITTYEKILAGLGYELEVAPIDGWGFER